MHAYSPLPQPGFRQCRLRIFRTTLWLLLASATPISQANDSTLRTTDAFHQNVELVDWSADGVLEFISRGDGDGKTRIETAAKNIVRFGVGQQARAEQGVLLVDGTLLVGRITQIDQQQCDLIGDYFRVSVPRPLIRSVLVNVPGLDGLRREWLDQALTAGGTDDLVQTIDGDWLTGTIEADPAGLIYQAGTRDQVNLGNGGQQRELAWPKLRGLIFSPLLTGLMPPPSIAVIVGLTDGTRLTVLQASEDLSGDWRFQLACGMEVRSRGDQFSKNRICFIGNSATALSTASHTAWQASDALRIRQTPNFGPVRTLSPAELSPPANAASGAGQGSLFVFDGWVASGFQMPPGTQAVFRLPPGAVRFTAELACGLLDGSEHLQLAASTSPTRGTISIVSKAGKVANAWTSEPLSPGHAIIPVDADIPPTAVALILSVERIGPNFAATNSVWLTPLVHQQASRKR